MMMADNGPDEPAKVRPSTVLSAEDGTRAPSSTPQQPTDPQDTDQLTKTETPSTGKQASLGKKTSLGKKPSLGKKTRERLCVVKREAMDPAVLIRFALSPDGVVTPDLAEKLPGRGAWVEANSASLEAAASKGLFARAFKSAAKLPDGMDPRVFVDFVASLLQRRILDGFGMARRHGSAVTGFDQVQALLKANKAGLLVSAISAGEDGASKLSRLAGHLDVTTIRAFSVDDLSGALGKPGVHHLAVERSALCDRLVGDLARWQGLLGATNSGGND
ncbi:MAG: DUF448 domain-containing protein [Pseudomonadota bacterium]